MNSVLPPGMGPRRAAALIEDTQANLFKCVNEIRVMREVLGEAAPFLTDEHLYDALKLRQFKAARGKVAAILKARPTLLREDAPELFKK